MSMTAIDGALASLIEAQNYLEKYRPTVAEVEKAKDAAKSAADILKAAHTLMEMDFYQVAKPQVDRYVDPAEHRIEMPEVRHEIAAAEPIPLPPMPDLFLAGFLETHPEAQKVAFESALEDLDQAGMDANPDDSSDWDDQAWWDAFTADRAMAWQKVIFATHHRKPFSFLVPTDEEFGAWVAQFSDGKVVVATISAEQIEEYAALAEDMQSPAEQLAQFNQQLHQLEETGVKESKFKHKNWAKAEQCWRAAFTADPAKALRKIAWVLGRNVIGWDVPSDEEIQPAEADPFEEGGAL